VETDGASGLELAKTEAHSISSATKIRNIRFPSRKGMNGRVFFGLAPNCQLANPPPWMLGTGKAVAHGNK
jgi:hypothetical protein